MSVTYDTATFELTAHSVGGELPPPPARAPTSLVHERQQFQKQRRNARETSCCLTIAVLCVVLYNSKLVYEEKEVTAVDMVAPLALFRYASHIAIGRNAQDCCKCWVNKFLVFWIL